MSAAINMLNPEKPKHVAMTLLSSRNKSHRPIALMLAFKNSS